MYLCNPNAEIAQLVEHDLAKVGVASSSLVFRSKRLAAMRGVFVCGQVTVHRRPCDIIDIFGW